MLRWLGDALASSIGKKALMSITGLMLVGFLFVHLAGNLTLLFGGDGTFDAYVAQFQKWGYGLYVAEVLLLLLFGAHIYLALRVSLENSRARAQGYAVRNNRGQSTLGSTSMLITGVIVLAFLVVHLLDFRFKGDFQGDPAGMVRAVLANPLKALAYIAALVALTIHLTHAIKSAFQSLGIRHPKLTPLIDRLGLVVALFLGLGFVCFPIVLWLFGGGSN